MKNKGELSINMIIVIALGILVLVILAIVFADRIRGQETASSCISKGGVCLPDGCAPGAQRIVAKCPGEDTNPSMECCPIV